MRPWHVDIRLRRPCLTRRDRQLKELRRELGATQHEQRAALERTYAARVRASLASQKACHIAWVVRPRKATQKASPRFFVGVS